MRYINYLVKMSLIRLCTLVSKYVTKFRVLSSSKTINLLSDQLIITKRLLYLIGYFRTRETAEIILQLAEKEKLFQVLISCLEFL